MEPEYEVEKIIKKRYMNGKAQYRLKWRNFSSRSNTWEWIENLNCAELLDIFERKENVAKVLSTRIFNGIHMYLIQKRFEKDAIEMSAIEAHENCLDLVLHYLENAIVWTAPPRRSYDFVSIGELVFIPDEMPIEITYASKINRNLMYWVKWSNGGKFVASKEARARWPILVVEFLERMLVFP